MEKETGDNLASLFPRPVIESQQIVFKAFNLSENAHILQNKEDIASFENKILKLNSFIKELSKKYSPEAKQWYKVLRKAIIIPSKEFIFCEDNNFALFFWGHKYLKKTGYSAFNIVNIANKKNEKNNQKNFKIYFDNPELLDIDQNNDNFNDLNQNSENTEKNIPENDN